MDELYALDPNDFVAARNDLAKRLRKEGDRAQADEVAELRRPTPAAWAVNQLVRRHRSDVQELVLLGEALRDAQNRALAGDPPGDLRQVGRARQDAVARLGALADRLLVERGGSPGAHAGEVAATLEAASLDAEAGAAVLEGRLTTELHPPSGFGAFDPTMAPAPPAKPALAPAEPGASEREDRARREAEEAVREARRRWEEQTASAKGAVEKVTASRMVVREAEREVERLEDELSQAQRRLRAAARDAELAEDAASRAGDTAERATQRLRDAERRAADL